MLKKIFLIVVATLLGAYIIFALVILPIEKKSAAPRRAPNTDLSCSFMVEESKSGGNRKAFRIFQHSTPAFVLNQAGNNRFPPMLEKNNRYPPESGEILLAMGTETC